MPVMTTHIKKADNANSKDYELAFSNIAHQYVQDRAPRLSEHEVGFQLLDKSEEGDKAVGVFGFKAGTNWFYAPVFYLSGKVKGYELLYIKHENIFVPLRENWVNYLLSQRPQSLGKSIDRNSRLFGVSNPDLTQLSRSPSKYASAQPGFDVELYRGLTKAACDASVISAKFKDLDLGDFLKAASRPVIEKFVQICQEFPKVAQAFNRWHGLPVLAEAMKSAAAREVLPIDRGVLATYKPRQPTMNELLGIKQADETPDNGAQHGLEVLSPQNVYQSVVPAELDQEHLEKMLKEDVLLRDNRIDSAMSRLYLAESTSTLTNPTTTGVYDVLLKEGEFSKCLVLVSPMGATHPSPFCTVVELGGDPSYVNVKTADVWVGNSDGKFAYGDWFKELPDQPMDARDYYVFIGPNGESTAPFSREYSYASNEVIPPSTTPDGVKIYSVEIDDYHSGRYSTMPSLRFTQQVGNNGSDYDKYSDGVRMHVDGTRGSCIIAHRGDVYIPAGFKLVKARVRPPNKRHDLQNEVSPPSTRNVEPIALGDLASAYFHLVGKRANFELGTLENARQELLHCTDELRLLTANGRIQINQQSFASKTAALVHLVRDHKLREKQARHLLEESRNLPHHPVEYRIKYAENVTRDAHSAPTIPADYISSGSIINPDQATAYKQEYALPIQSLRAQYADRELYNPNTKFDRNAGQVGDGFSRSSAGGQSSLDDQSSGDLAAAMQSGQKEVFDTSVIGTLLKAVRDDTLVDRYLAPMVGGVDALGRLLFMFYWHGDEFAERYGKQDMPELEDSLRNAFEQAGDVVLFLRQKSVNPQGDGSTAIDLGASSNATNGL